MPLVSKWDSTYGVGAQGVYGSQASTGVSEQARVAANQGVTSVSTFQQVPSTVVEGWQNHETALQGWQNYLDEPPMSMGSGSSVLGNAESAALATNGGVYPQTTWDSTTASSTSTSTSESSGMTIEQQLEYQQVEAAILKRNSITANNIDTTMDFSSSDSSSSAESSADAVASLFSYDGGSGDGGGDDE